MPGWAHLGLPCAGRAHPTGALPCRSGLRPRPGPGRILHLPSGQRAAAAVARERCGVPWARSRGRAPPAVRRPAHPQGGHMRRLLLLLAVMTLMVAACGDDTSFTLSQPTTTGAETTTTTAGPGTTVTPTTGEATGTISKQGGRRDPALARSPVMSRALPHRRGNDPSSAATRIPAPISGPSCTATAARIPSSTSCGTIAPRATWGPAMSSTGRHRSIRSTRRSGTAAAGRPTAEPGARPRSTSPTPTSTASTTSAPQVTWPPATPSPSNRRPAPTSSGSDTPAASSPTAPGGAST